MTSSKIAFVAFSAVMLVATQAPAHAGPRDPYYGRPAVTERSFPDRTGRDFLSEPSLPNRASSQSAHRYGWF